MFAYILKAPGSASTAQTDDFFRRFLETPGLLHAFDLEGVADATDSAVVAIWESREAAEHYLNKAPLRQEVDEAMPAVTRTLYNVRQGR